MLQIDKLHKRIHGLCLADDISLVFGKGKRHAIIGPNGAGKTSLFNLISGELRADSGCIFYDGVDISGLPVYRRSRLGIARSFQRNNLFTSYSVADNLRFADIAVRGFQDCFWRKSYVCTEFRVQAMAERLGLRDILEYPVAELSYGVLRQLEIGLALMCEPRLLLLDEPGAGMSPGETSMIMGLIDSLDRDLTILLIEHDMDIVFTHADMITVMDGGRILFTGTPSEVRSADSVRAVYLGFDDVGFGRG